MSTAIELAPSVTTDSNASSLSPTFQVELRRRHDEQGPVVRVSIRARTIASVRHAIRLQYPDAVVVAISKG
jgi:hypothetical protein